MVLNLISSTVNLPFTSITPKVASLIIPPLFSSEYVYLNRPFSEVSSISLFFLFHTSLLQLIDEEGITVR
jgi:hypothetical protein